MQQRRIARWFCTTQIAPVLRYVGISIPLLTAAVCMAKGVPDSSIKAGIDFPYFGKEHKLVQDIQFSALDKTTGKLQFNCFRYTVSQDSIWVYGQKEVSFKASSGVSQFPIKFGPNSANSFVLPQFYDILRKCGNVPAGTYKVYLTIVTDSAITIQRVFHLNADSTLPPTSSLSKQLNTTFSLNSEKQKGLFGSVKNTATQTVSSIPAAKIIERNASRLNRQLKTRGLTSQTEQRGDKSVVNVWYENWFVGRYELEANKSASSQIKQKQAQVAGNVSAFAGNELETYRSLFSQVRELAKSDKEDNELRGELSTNGNFSNGQPEYSAQDNNYYELRGRAETEVADIPVSIEGYYTTQDAYRHVKGSYIRVHYDAERAKSKLMKIITGYRNQFSQTLAKGAGLEQVYGSYLGNLQNSKDRALIDLKREAGIPLSSGGSGLDTSGLQDRIQEALSKKMPDTAGLAGKTEGKLDSAGAIKNSAAKAAKVKDSAVHKYAKAMKQYEQIQKTQAQIEKYSALLEQYRNTTYFDSALAYSKIKDLKSGDETTYKQMAKSAAGLLPEGKAKTFIAGLTNLDAGIFSKYTSKYTAAGQQLKGIDVGYDIGFAQIGLTAGSTEYAGRDGSLDKYTTYSGRMLFSPAKGQKAGLVYYGYTPSKSMVGSNDFFKNAGIALPTFRAPVHIVSATYEGTIAKTVLVEVEAATSYRNGSGQAFSSSFNADRIAWHLNAESAIPKTPLSLLGSYEHGGKDFENSTLPLTISGIDLYKIGAKGEFLHGFLTAGIQYNHIQQSNLYSTGGNSRWGFDIATHSKQYPSVSFSYKPFATFRASSDTLTIPQRPLQGAVWTGKATYQIKKKGGVSYRFSAVLNRSTSHADSISYGADLLQLNAIYTDKQWMLMLSTGQSMLQTNSGGYRSDSLNPAHVRTTFGMGSVSYSFSKTTSVTGGADIGFAPFGLSKWGLSAGLSYRMSAAPLTARLSSRYSAYRLAAYSGAIGKDMGNAEQSEPMSWRNLIGGSVELIWQFRMKVNG